MSTFRSKLIAMKMAVGQIKWLWYKFCIFRVPVNGPTNVYGNRKAVFKNTTIPDMMLKKKHTSICYHRSCEVVVSQFAMEGTGANLSDQFTKSLPQAVWDFCWNVLPTNIKWFSPRFGFPLWVWC